MKPASKGRSAFLPVLFLGAASHLSIVSAQGTFTATGDMTTARSQHTATLLPNGKVLIAGGMKFADSGLPPRPGTAQSSAELYDPSKGTFAATGSMTTPRAGHTATLLPDGKVLIAGGSAGTGSLRGAELYDPARETFIGTGSMTAGGGSPAILLPDGRVLIFGAQTAEIYDAAIGTFTAADPYTGTGIARLFSATLLPNGKILMIGDGGYGVYGMWAAVYDPVAGVARPTGPIPDRWRASYSTTLLTGGKVLVAGGDNDLYYLSTAEVYDPSTGAFAPTGDMTTYRDFSTAILLPDGHVMISGGQLYGGAATASVDLYDPASGAFAATGNMTTTRSLHTATLLPDGSILIAGGDVGVLVQGLNLVYVPSSTANAEIYKPSMLKPSPVLLSLSGDGQGPGAIFHADTHQIISSDNPASVGEALEVYCTTGLGDGSDDSVIPPQVAIGGRAAEVVYFDGQTQVNVRVPNGVDPGDAIPVRLTYLGRPSNEVTISVR
jgi:hypothetical protein